MLRVLPEIFYRPIEIIRVHCTLVYTYIAEFRKYFRKAFLRYRYARRDHINKPIIFIRNEKKTSAV